MVYGMDGSGGAWKVLTSEQVFSVFLLKEKWPCLTGQAYHPKDCFFFRTLPHAFY